MQSTVRVSSLVTGEGRAIPGTGTQMKRRLKGRSLMLRAKCVSEKVREGQAHMHALVRLFTPHPTPAG